MGNVLRARGLSKEGLTSKADEKRQANSLEKAKKAANAERMKKLKAKRKSTFHQKVWDPSGDEDQGPELVKRDEDERDDDTDWKEQKVKRKSLAELNTKVWDPSGDEEQGPSIIDPDHATSWRAAVAEQNDGTKVSRDAVKLRRTSVAAKKKRATLQPQPMHRSLDTIRRSLPHIDGALNHRPLKDADVYKDQNGAVAKELPLLPLQPPPQVTSEANIPNPMNDGDEFKNPGSSRVLAKTGEQMKTTGAGLQGLI